MEKKDIMYDNMYVFVNIIILRKINNVILKMKIIILLWRCV